MANTGEMRKKYGVLVRKPEGKRPLEGPRHRWVDYMKMVPTKIETNRLN